MFSYIAFLKYICSWSGGKDSTASIILAHMMKEPLDTIIFSEVLFDKRNGISGENPKHIQWVKEVAIPLFESWGYEVLVLKADKDYLDIFYHLIKRPIEYPEHKGMRYGFPISRRCSIKRDCKERPIQKYLKSLCEPYIQYVGICYNEKRRLQSLKKKSNNISLLEKYYITEAMAREMCEGYGLLSPGYYLSDRGGCWFCPNAKRKEHQYLFLEYRELWDNFVALETESNLAQPIWSMFGETLKERNELFLSMTGE